MAKGKVFEIEVRGPLSSSKYHSLKKFLTQNSKKVNYKERVIIDFSESVGGKNLDERIIDLRIRSTNGVPEIILKKGKLAAQDIRDEVSILTEKGSFDKLIELFGSVGITKGILCKRNIAVFEYKGIEFALINIDKNHYTYEAEILLSNKKNSEIAIKKINAVCQELGLDIYSDKEFFDFIKLLDRSVNKKFDFANYKSGFFKSKYDI